MSEPLPPDLVQLIVTQIDSVELVDILCLLHSDQIRWFRVEEVNERIRSNIRSVGVRLDRLVALGLASCADGCYRCAPSDTATKLVETYLARRTTVIELIFSKPNRELASFSAAFKIRGKE